MRGEAEARRTVTSILERRLQRIDWTRVEDELDAAGWSRLGPLLAAAECRALRRAFAHDPLFRATVDMERHGFGRGMYRYFAAPVPPLIAALREGLYERLVGVARRWAAALRADGDFPDRLEAYLARCHAAASDGRRRCCCAIAPATTTACTRISTAVSPSRSRW